MRTAGRRRRLIAVAIGMVLVVAIASAAGYRAYRAAHLPKTDGVVTLEFTPQDIARLESRALARWLPLAGALQPLNAAVVKAKVSGDIRALAVREGQSVRAGDTLARIDTADLEAKLVDRMGALEAARAQLALAEKTQQMNLALLSRNFISRNAFDNSESGYNVAKGGVKSAEAQVQIARNALADAMVVAPIAGIVARRHVQPGEKVAFDSPVVTIVDLTQLELQAMVPAGDVPELAVGMPVELTVDGFDRRFAGRIERINPATEAGTRAIVVYVGIANRDQALKGGMYATGRVGLAAAAPLPTLPLTALRAEGGQTYVWTVRAGRLERRSVLVGRRDDEAGLVEIRSELPADLDVLASRFDNLREGAPAIVRAGGASTRSS
ncbi:MAG: efflux RND transporter periplasmic adaptor subunit [Casimicrobiaceae bacterium]